MRRGPTTANGKNWGSSTGGVGQAPSVPVGLRALPLRASHLHPPLIPGQHLPQRQPKLLGRRTPRATLDEVILEQCQRTGVHLSGEPCRASERPRGHGGRGDGLHPIENALGLFLAAPLKRLAGHLRGLELHGHGRDGLHFRGRATTAVRFLPTRGRAETTIRAAGDNCPATVTLARHGYRTVLPVRGRSACTRARDDLAASIRAHDGRTTTASTRRGRLLSPP